MAKNSDTAIAHVNQDRGVVYIAPDSATPLPQSIFNRIDTDSPEWKETIDELEAEAREIEARQHGVALEIAERIDFQLGIEDKE